MAINFQRTRRLLQQFNFRQLFAEELNWATPSAKPIHVDADGDSYAATPIAEQGGMVVFEIGSRTDGLIPGRSVQLKLHRRIAQTYAEHILVFLNAARSSSLWVWVKRQDGRLQSRDHWYHAGQPGDSLLQKLNGIAFAYEQLDEDGRMAIGPVLDAVEASFRAERVTKRFYEQFEKEHAAFLKFVSGIPDAGMERWYASVMLNRLMFIYFIQRKLFLSGDRDYLLHKLQEGEYPRGFYRGFLCPLFFRGFALKQAERSEADRALLGPVPYLNGGIFQQHEIEQLYGEDIEIPDNAFGRLFDFFDRWQWQLDERPLRRDDEINPDVLGYIFEKYINRKQMGAYYTKEDITGYISRNTILPFLLDAARRKCNAAFEGEASVWTLLRDDPDRYIYEAVRFGSETELPAEIAAGVADVAKRSGWNKAAAPQFALPTEIWRETVARRERYRDLRRRLAAGNVHDVNDLVTLNLDSERFARDVVENAEPDLLNSFYKELKSITVLDPTCGSGAFLFAALNLLYPLYEACLNRMRVFVEDWQRLGDKTHRNYAKWFASEIKAVEEDHPNQRYFILKTIILNNLYGVDIMKEATEICRLRLFLKLAAQVEPNSAKPNLGIEPLPDIDFNIRAGNTLVGYATADEVRRSMTDYGDGQMRLGIDDELNSYARFCEKVEIADRAYQRFREMQTRQGMAGDDSRDAKEELRRRLALLEDELNRHMAKDYGIAIDTTVSVPEKLEIEARHARVAEPRAEFRTKRDRSTPFRKWLDSHHPLHWFIDFYGIIRDGGFDIVIGNPPYIAKAQIRNVYRLLRYETDGCSDIYANVLERVGALSSSGARTGMIVPLSLTFSGDFGSLRAFLFRRYNHNWFSSFARIPAALFSADVRVRNTIHLGWTGKGRSQQHSTVLHRWFEAARPHLFGNLCYADFNPETYKGLIPKIGLPSLSTAYEKCFAHTNKTVLSFFATGKTDHVLHFKKSAYNWLNFCRRLPPCFDENGRRIAHTKFGDVHFRDKETRDLAFLLLNGKIMFDFWGMIGDDFDVTQWMFADFPIDLEAIPAGSRIRLLTLADHLDELMRANVSYKLNAGKKVGNYNLALCRSLTDRTDAIFLEVLQMSSVREDIELMYGQIVKTNFSSESEDE